MPVYGVLNVELRPLFEKGTHFKNRAKMEPDPNAWSNKLISKARFNILQSDNKLETHIDYIAAIYMEMHADLRVGREAHTCFFYLRLTALSSTREVNLLTNFGQCFYPLICI